MSEIHDPTECWLGEGPLWHPGRQQLYWFDIVNGHLHTRENDATRTFDLGENASAAAWIDSAHLLVATETKLVKLELANGTTAHVADLEPDMPDNRCNDGRADPWGGFWIGTMHKAERVPSGAFYRYYRGEVRKLYDGITIPNACCFAPDGSVGYWTDTIDNVIRRIRFDSATGWPSGEPEAWLDLSRENFGADGAVVDADGNIWIACWGGWAVRCYAPDGRYLRHVDIDAAHTSCPAFGGPDLTTLYVTTAGGRVTDDDRARSDKQGMVHFVEDVAKGQPEHRVIL